MLKKRQRELASSRDGYKEKYYALKSLYDVSQQEIKELKAELEQKRKERPAKPRGHSYSLFFICLMLRLITIQGMKFKTLARDEHERSIQASAESKSPSAVSLRNWTLKLGYYVLEKQTKPNSDWIIVLDHSIQFGQEKIFAVFGIEYEAFKKLNRPLKITDLHPLVLKTGTTWNGQNVSEELTKLQTEYGTIRYAVGDYGSDLRKGLRLSSIGHVHDLSHMVSLLIEKTYGQWEAYTNLKKEMSQMRSKFIQTNIAAIVPPKQRKKSEYQNFDTLVAWAKKALLLLDTKLKNTKSRSKLESQFSVEVLKRMKKELKWLQAYRGVIDELSKLSNLCRKIEKRFKHKGFSSKTFGYAKKMLKSSGSQRIRAFQSQLLEKLQEQSDLMQGEEKFLCSSDILESTFGAYKNRQSENQMASVTNLMLIMAAFTAEITEDLVREALENVKMTDLENWSKKEIGVSLAKQRRLLLSGT